VASIGLQQQQATGQSFAALLRSIKKSIQQLREDLGRVSNDNYYTLQYLLSQKTTATDHRPPRSTKRPLDDDDDEEEDNVGNVQEFEDDGNWNAVDSLQLMQEDA
jgi:hypothetical protein